MDNGPDTTPKHRASPPNADDPRLAIPEVLRERPTNQAQQRADQSRESFGDTAKAWGMGLDLVFTTIGGFALGWGFDWWRGTEPWGAIIGLGMGFLFAVIRLIRYAIKAEAREQAERERQYRSDRHK